MNNKRALTKMFQVWFGLNVSNGKHDYIEFIIFMHDELIVLDITITIM